MTRTIIIKPEGPNVWGSDESQRLGDSNLLLQSKGKISLIFVLVQQAGDFVGTPTTSLDKELQEAVQNNTYSDVILTGFPALPPVQKGYLWKWLKQNSEGFSCLLNGFLLWLATSAAKMNPASILFELVWPPAIEDCHEQLNVFMAQSVPQEFA